MALAFRKRRYSCQNDKRATYSWPEEQGTAPAIVEQQHQADSSGFGSCCGFGTAFLCQVLSSIFKRFAAECPLLTHSSLPACLPVCVCPLCPGLALSFMYLFEAAAAAACIA